MSKGARKAGKQGRRGRWVLRTLLALLGLGILGVLAGVLAFWMIWIEWSEDLPDIAKVSDYAPKQTTRVYAAGGELIAEWTDDERIFRTLLDFEEIPQVMRDAMLAAEDSEFYQHPGLDVRGLLRAALVNLRERRAAQGASTITQQVVKNLVLSPERTYRRKFQELILAFRLEANLSKDDILTIYLNEVFFGRHAYGVEEAARFYFGISAQELNLEQAALLAGLVQSPNRYNPYRHPERALARRAYVLRQMWEKGMIEEGTWRAADEAELVLAGDAERPPWLGRFPYYTDAVRREVLSLAEEMEDLDTEGLFASGLEIHTWLDVAMQEAAENALVAGLQEFDTRRGFRRPFRTLEDDEAVSRWIREQHAEARRQGLSPDAPQRAVIIHSDDEETRMRIGDWTFRLDRRPASRHRANTETPWEEALPPRAVYTVVPLRTWTPEQLDAVDEAPLVRFQPSAEGALVAIRPEDRAVVALTGGYDFAYSAFNRAVQARRQTGSAFKTFVFAAALESRTITPASVYVDQPFTQAMDVGPDWRPRNHDGRYDGPMSTRTALARSRNTVTAQILRQAGVTEVQDFTRRAGVDARLPDGLSLALGAAELTPLELTNAYATFAAEGRWAEASTLRSLSRAWGGEVLYQREAEQEERLDPSLAWLVTSMLRSVITEGTGARARRTISFDAVGKTGTTNDTRDAWFVGYSSSLVAGVWVGRDSFESLGRGEGGSATALPIWADFMARAHASEAPASFSAPPAGIEEVRIDADSGLRARPGAEGARSEYFLRGSAPMEFASSPQRRSVEDVLLRGAGESSGGGEGEHDYNF